MYANKFGSCTKAKDKVSQTGMQICKMQSRTVIKSNEDEIKEIDPWTLKYKSFVLA